MLILFLIVFFISSCFGEKILQISDFHFDADYSPVGDTKHECHAGKGGGKIDIGFYGNYLCDSPQSLVKHALMNAQRILPNPEIILWTGDNVPHISDYNDQCKA